MIVLWLIVFVVCCGECLGLCLLLLHSRSLSPCVCRVIHAHVSPSPSHVLCEACHMHCVVVVGTLQHTALLCSILSALLFLSLSLPPPSPEKTQGMWREEREKGVDGERERKRKKRGVMQKRVEKGEQKEKKRLRHLVFPGCLQP